MQLRNTSWIVKIAYMFTQQNELPAQVDRCTLWQRFCLMLTPWILLNIFAWLIGFVVLGIIAHVVWRAILFVFVGQKLVYDPHDNGQSSSIVGFSAVKRVLILRYEREDIWWMNWSQFQPDFRCPILMVIFGLMTLGICWLFIRSIPGIFHTIVSAATAAGSAAYGTIGWWGSGLSVLIALGILSYIGRKGYSVFAATPSGAVIVSHIREWKEQHCKIIELV